MMKGLVQVVLAIVLVGAVCSCVTVPTKGVQGNFELTVAPVSEDDRPLHPRVYLDNKFIGHATASKPILYLKRGKHTLRVELEGYETWEETVHLLGDPNQQVLHVRLKKSSAE